MKKGLPILTLMAVLCLWAFSSARLQAQDKPAEDHSYKPLTLKLNEDGSKYVRFIMWHQIWAETNNLSVDGAKFDVNFSIRRSRFLAYAQISPRFLVLTHWGLNSLNGANLTATGTQSNAPQLFLHDAWAEFKISNALYAGAGLHYWKGLTRLASQSTLNFMTLDQSRPFVHWHSLGYTDQFARHLGVYLKGESGKFEYTLAINDAGRNGFEASTTSADERVVYNGVNIFDRNGDRLGTKIVEGYVSYSFWDKESTKLPFKVGTYMGSKKVFNIGAGFFAHPNGAYDGVRQEHVNVQHFAVDAFLDIPVGSIGNGLNAYVSFINFNYGENWKGNWAGTGNNIYAHLGYFIKSAKLMPYVAFNNGNYDANDNLDRKTTNALDIGMNYFINGHNAKLTFEYHSIRPADNKGGNGKYAGDVSQIRVQAHVFL